MAKKYLICEAEAAEYLGLSPKTLARWRWAGKGPVFHKLGSAVRYSVEELESFVSSAVVAR
ncbi:MAG: helix-turn-helix domain-containing protein [Pseudomonadota bacterium]